MCLDRLLLQRFRQPWCPYHCNKLVILLLFFIQLTKASFWRFGLLVPDVVWVCDGDPSLSCIKSAAGHGWSSSFVLVIWTLINVFWAAAALWPQKWPPYFLLAVPTNDHKTIMPAVLRSLQHCELRNTTTLFIQGIFSSVQYFVRLLFDLVEFCKDIPFQRILWQPICWTNNRTNQKNSGENLRLLWWGDKVPQNWFDVSLPLNLKEKILFTLIGARCGNRMKENPLR